LGSFHADPHPGNLLVLSDKSKGELAILDFGLMAQLRKEDMEVGPSLDTQNRWMGTHNR
jgi:predicted unusual protein kinase regulating ubiquinone biosynthesis (AarF/ABC1/UbiB family)